MTFKFSLFNALNALLVESAEQTNNNNNSHSSNSDSSTRSNIAAEWRSILALRSSSRGAQLDRLALAMLRAEDVALNVLRVARPLTPDLLCRLLTRSAPSIVATSATASAAQLPTMSFAIDARFDVWLQSRAFTAALLLPAMPHTLT